MVEIRCLLAHVFGPGSLYTTVDINGDLSVLKIAWCSLKKVCLILDLNHDMSPEDISLEDCVAWLYEGFIKEWQNILVAGQLEEWGTDWITVAVVSPIGTIVVEGHELHEEDIRLMYTFDQATGGTTQFEAHSDAQVFFCSLEYFFTKR